MAPQAFGRTLRLSEHTIVLRLRKHAFHSVFLPRPHPIAKLTGALPYKPHDPLTRARAHRPNRRTADAAWSSQNTAAASSIGPTAAHCLRVLALGSRCARLFELASSRINCHRVHVICTACAALGRQCLRHDATCAARRRHDVSIQTCCGMLRGAPETRCFNSDMMPHAARVTRTDRAGGESARFRRFCFEFGVSFES